MEEKCMQDFGRKTPSKGPVKDVDADSNVTLKTSERNGMRSCKLDSAGSGQDRTGQDRTEQNGFLVASQCYDLCELRF
jgi:hypothetical protein